VYSFLQELLFTGHPSIEADGKDEEGNSVYLYGASDEEGKININTVEAKILAKLPNFSDEIVAAVLDWRDEDSVAGNHIGGTEGAEDSYYEGLDNPYECKDAPFSAPEELLLVKGITDEICDGVKGFITVYGEGKTVNINTASEGVLAALAGEDFETLAGKIIDYRNGADELPGTEDDVILKNIKAIPAQVGMNELEQAVFKTIAEYFKFSSDTFRVIARGEVKEGRVKKTIEAVVGRDKEGSRTLYYYED